MIISSEIIDKLTTFGLTNQEGEVYAYLQSQPQTVLNISRQLQIPRTTIYDIVNKLIEKGLAQRLVKYKSQEIKAAPLETLEVTIFKEKQHVDELSESFQYLKEHLQISTSAQISTKVKYYHGRQGFQQMMWNALSAKKETVGYSEFGRVEVVGEHFLQQWLAEFKRRGLRDRVVTNPSASILEHIKTNVKPGKHQLTSEDIRCLDEKVFHASGDTTIYNDTFAVCYWRQGEVVGVEIENPELVKTQKTIFALLWSQATPITKLLKLDNI